MGEEVKLLGAWASPFSFRIKMALEIKGIEYEYTEIDLLNKGDLLLKLNPIHKKIPVVIHNQKAIAESLVLLEYIDEIWTNNPLMPQDSYQRATARFWAKFIDQKVLETAVKIRDEGGENYQELYEELKMVEKKLEGEGTEFFGGERVGYLDIVAFSLIYWIRLGSEVKSGFITQHKLPVLYNWMDKILQLDVVKESLPPRDLFLSLMAARMQVQPPKSAP